MIAKRKAWSILVLLGGSGSLLVGALFHAQTVSQDREREVSIATPAPFGFQEPPSAPRGDLDDRPPPDEKPEPDRGAMPDNVNPFDPPPAGKTAPETAENPFESRAKPAAEEDPFATPPVATGQLPPVLPPGMKLATVMEKYLEVLQEPEWVLVREVTVGGVTRLANGELKRTYSGKPPALCPT